MNRNNESLSTTPLRNLFDDAEIQVDRYKSPDIDDFKQAMSDVLEAAGEGSLMSDKVESICELSWNGQKYIEIETSWSARSCLQTSTYRLPSFIIDSEDPIREATKWKLEKSKNETESKLKQAQADVIRYTAKLDELNTELEKV